MVGARSITAQYLKGLTKITRHQPYGHFSKRFLDYIVGVYFFIQILNKLEWPCLQAQGCTSVLWDLVFTKIQVQVDVGDKFEESPSRCFRDTAFTTVERHLDTQPWPLTKKKSARPGPKFQIWFPQCIPEKLCSQEKSHRQTTCKHNKLRKTIPGVFLSTNHSKHSLL